MIGIYKITNKANGKSYIGQSVNIKGRFNSHKVSDSDLGLDIQKYGVSNFSFEVLEECSIDELNQLEVFYIEKYDTFKNGYNKTIGGMGTRGSGHVLDYETVYKIIKDIEEDKSDNFECIANKYGVSSRVIRSINSGDSWVVQGLEYPIVKRYRKNMCECGEIIKHTSSRCSKCYGLSIRKTNRPDKDTLLKEVLELGFEGTGRKYGVSGSSIKKWMKAYDLPHLMSELKPKKKKTPMKELMNFNFTIVDKENNEFFFSTVDDFVVFIQSNNLSKGSRASIRNGINRIIRRERKSYLGFKVKD